MPENIFIIFLFAVGDVSHSKKGEGEFFKLLIL